MLGPPKLRLLDEPVAVSLEALVPSNHFYRHLDAVLDLSFVRDWVTGDYADRGRPSIDPVVFFKLQLILFFEGLRSERKLMETVALNLAHRCYLGYRLDEALPDHSSLTRMRARLGLLLFQRFVERVVELCQDAGLIWGKERFFDATKVRANADIAPLVPRWYAAAKAHVEDLFASDAVEAAATPTPNSSEPTEHRAEGAVPVATPSDAVAVAAAAAPDPAVPSRLPFAGTAEAEQHLAATNQTTWRRLEQYRLDPQRPAADGYQRISDLRVSTTDPDGAPMRAHRGDRTKRGDHDH